MILESAHSPLYCICCYVISVIVHYVYPMSLWLTGNKESESESESGVAR
jgi:hypothetical protein